MLRRDREAPHGVGERDADGMRRRPVRARAELRAPPRERRGATGALVGGVVDHATEGVERLETARGVPAATSGTPGEAARAGAHDALALGVGVGERVGLGDRRAAGSRAAAIGVPGSSAGRHAPPPTSERATRPIFAQRDSVGPAP